MVGLEPVSGHLVEEDAAEAAADHDRHRAGGRRHGVEQDERLAGGTGGDRGGVVVEELEATVPAEGLGAGLDPVAAAGDGLGADPHPGAIVAAEQAGGVGDRDLAPRLAVGGHRLRYLAAGRAGALVQLTQQLRLTGGGDVAWRALDRLRAPLFGTKRPRLGAIAAQRRRRLVGRPLDVGGVEAVDVGEVGRAAAQHPHPGSLFGAGLHRLDPRLVDRQGQAAAPFGEDLGELAAVGEGAGDDPLGNRRVEQLRSVTHCFGFFPATSISRPAATKSSPPISESPAWSSARPPL